MSYTTIFFLVNLIGGGLVIGGYVVGFSLYSEAKITMWGGITSSQKPIFQVSMIFAALGYLLFCYMGLFKFGNGWEFLRETDSIVLIVLCALFLVSAALWLPFGIWHQETGKQLAFVLMAVSLWITAFSLAGMTTTILLRSMEISNIVRIISSIGLSYITFHCLVFDALIWLLKYPR